MVHGFAAEGAFLHVGAGLLILGALGVALAQVS
jgi:hypothetical protein